MREPYETTNLAEMYDQELMPWSRAAEAMGTGSLDADTACFLGTVGRDGRPHSAGVGVTIAEDGPYFTSGPGRAKARNVAAQPACVLSMRLPGLDLVLEGEAHRVTEAATIDRIVAAYRDGGWPAERAGEAITAPYSAQSAGPGPWHLYRVDVHTAIGVGLRPPHGASRWRFKA